MLVASPVSARTQPETTKIRSAILNFRHFKFKVAPGGQEMKSCGVGVVDLHLYFSSGYVLMGAGTRNELLGTGSGRGEELVL